MAASAATEATPEVWTDEELPTRLRLTASPPMEMCTELIDRGRDPTPGGRQRAIRRLGFPRHMVGSEGDGAQCCGDPIARHDSRVPRAKTMRRGAFRLVGW